MRFSSTIRIILSAALSTLLLSALFESATCLCSDDADCCGPCMLCLCTQALETPDAVGAVNQPVSVPVMPVIEQDQFVSLTFRPPTPPPRA